MGAETQLQQQIFQRNTDFINAIEFMDNVIANASLGFRNLWFDLIPRGAMPLGEGLVRKTHRFHGARGDQAGLQNWEPIQRGRDPSPNDPGYNTCNYSAELVDSGFETIEWTGFQSFKRTPDICINDLKFDWEFDQQLDLIMSHLSDITIATWENWGREMYMAHAADEGNIFVLTNGSPNGTPLVDLGGGNGIYNPFTSTEIRIPRDVPIGTLEWDFFAWHHQFLTDMAPRGAVAQDGDMPLFGLPVHPIDIDDMIHRDPQLREDLRYSNPNVLVENYGKVKQFKGYALTNDIHPMRFRAKSGGTTASHITLERVLPYFEEDITIKTKPHLDPAYLNAEFAMGAIFLTDVFDTLVPAAGPANPGGGTSFGVTPSLMGEFTWLNIPDIDRNPLSEIGRYFARFQGFARPGIHSQEAIGFLYKRCVQTTVFSCIPCEVQADAAEVVAVSSVTAIVDEEAGETAASYTKVSVTLAQCLDCTSPSSLFVDYAAAVPSEAFVSDVTGVLVADAGAPTYELIFDTEADHATLITATARVLCA